MMMLIIQKSILMFLINNNYIGISNLPMSFQDKIIMIRTAD